MEPEQNRNGGGPRSAIVVATDANAEAANGDHQQAVERALGEFVDKMTPRVNVLENEVMYAWRALDLLSDEYVKMWERIEKLETIVQNQQSVIGQMVELCSEPTEDGTSAAVYASARRLQDMATVMAGSGGGGDRTGLSMIWEEAEGNGNGNGEAVDTGAAAESSSPEPSYGEEEDEEDDNDDDRMLMRLLDGSGGGGGGGGDDDHGGGDDPERHEMDSAESSAKELFENIEQMERNMRQLYAEAQLDSWNDETERAAAALDYYPGPLGGSSASAVLQPPPQQQQRRMYPSYTCSPSPVVRSLPAVPKSDESAVGYGAPPSFAVMDDAAPSAQDTTATVPALSPPLSQSAVVAAYMAADDRSPTYRPQSPSGSPPPPAPDDPVFPHRSLSSALSLSLRHFHDADALVDPSLHHRQFHSSTKDLHDVARHHQHQHQLIHYHLQHRYHFQQQQQPNLFRQNQQYRQPLSHHRYQFDDGQPQHRPWFHYGSSNELADRASHHQHRTGGSATCPNVPADSAGQLLPQQSSSSSSSGFDKSVAVVAPRSPADYHRPSSAYDYRQITVASDGPSGGMVTVVTSALDYPYYDRSTGVYSTAGYDDAAGYADSHRPPSSSISNVPDLLDVMSYKEQYKKPGNGRQPSYPGITDALAYYPSTDDGDRRPGGRYHGGRYATTGAASNFCRDDDVGTGRDESCAKAKKSKRNIIRSAMSSVSSSVSNWFPDVRLPPRHRSHSLPGGLEKEPDAMSVRSETASKQPGGWHGQQRHGGSRKKKKSIVSTVSGLLHKTAAKPARYQSSYSISDPEFAENEWTRLKAGDRAAPPLEPQKSPPQPPPISSSSLDRPANINITAMQQQQQQQFQRHEDEPQEAPVDEIQLPAAMFNGPSKEFAVSRKLSKYRERCKLVNGQLSLSVESEPSVTATVTTVQERRNRSLEEPATVKPGNDESAQSSANSTARNLKLTSRQASLEVPWAGKGSADTEDDSRSNHSWRSTSRISSRRQSTEESIDSDDEWYCYELKQLEELEKKTHFERVFGPSMLPPATTRPESSVLGSKADFKEKMTRAIEDIRKQSVDEPCTEDVFAEQPEQPLDTVVEEEPPPTRDDGPIRFKKMKVPDTPGGKRDVPGEELPVDPEQGPGTAADDELIMATDEDESPGAPSLPLFKFDKNDLADKEEASCSKWKIVKALKEKKPEELNQDIGPPPTPIVEVKIR